MLSSLSLRIREYTTHAWAVETNCPITESHCVCVLGRSGNFVHALSSVLPRHEKPDLVVRDTLFLRFAVRVWRQRGGSGLSGNGQGLLQGVAC